MEKERIQQFNEKELKIRKKWLFWKIKIPVLILVALFIFSFFQFDFNLFVSFFLMFALIFLIASIGLSISYYCSYKLTGTKLLLFDMFFIPFPLILLFFELHLLIDQNPDYNLSKLNSLSLIPIGIFAALILYDMRLMYLSFKLRQVNKNLKKRRMFESMEYAEYLSIFQSADNIIDLKERYQKLIRENKSGRARNIIKQAFLIRKNTFENVLS